MLNKGSERGSFSWSRFQNVRIFLTHTICIYIYIKPIYIGSARLDQARARCGLGLEEKFQARARVRTFEARARARCGLGLEKIFWARARSLEARARARTPLLSTFSDF
jgi:hypothetical protein